MANNNEKYASRKNLLRFLILFNGWTAKHNSILSMSTKAERARAVLTRLCKQTVKRSRINTLIIPLAKLIDWSPITNANRQNSFRIFAIHGNCLMLEFLIVRSICFLSNTQHVRLLFKFTEEEFLFDSRVKQKVKDGILQPKKNRESCVWNASRIPRVVVTQYSTVVTIMELHEDHHYYFNIG